VFVYEPINVMMCVVSKIDLFYLAVAVVVSYLFFVLEVLLTLVDYVP
jgi:hypothetical protein